jgi:hypothetical protein
MPRFGVAPERDLLLTAPAPRDAAQALFWPTNPSNVGQGAGKLLNSHLINLFAFTDERSLPRLCFIRIKGVRQEVSVLAANVVIIKNGKSLTALYCV